ncbi:Maf-like protein YceF [Legionella massiliensis]|uniref:Nucleoside triphosphate pyrophosphatase n=1 Tax=Legionella massiliensis TaxID=1034943 RepID=A0A078KTA9_9GAMM|nr:Maf family nucleotide pyrophosphatase [Legionella massiliensis]CDZ77710.1 Maf-like protein YceF [Legionella massiliensis]CEE13448.1 Maf-like protein YceF [Legionella massiliensis]
MSEFIKQEPLILASASQTRLKLLHSLGLHFEVIPSNCDEDSIKQSVKTDSPEDLRNMAALLAASKALEVSKRNPSHFVIAADQLCVIGNQYLDKPITHENAVNHLRLLSGKTHQQIAATCIAKNGAIVWQHQDIAILKMQTLSDKTIEHYLRMEKPYQSCGAYNYEGRAKWLFKDVEGSESTILGLPLLPLTQALIELQAISL